METPDNLFCQAAAAPETKLSDLPVFDGVEPFEGGAFEAQAGAAERGPVVIVITTLALGEDRAVRLDDGGLEVASGLKPLRAAEIENRFIRGPARMAETFALLPEIRRRLPAAQLPFQRPAVAAAMVGSAAAVRLVRGSKVIVLEYRDGKVVVAPFETGERDVRVPERGRA